MAMVGDDLGVAMATAAGVAGNPAALTYWKALGNAIVLYITTHAQVATTDTVTIPVGVTGLLSPPTGGPVTATGTPPTWSGAGTGTIS